MDMAEKKRIVAKLYNLKSYIDGKIQEVNADMLSPVQLSEGLSLMTMKLCNELDPAPEEISG